jgi:hypothetical protein
MSTSENQEGEQRGGRVLTIVFWAGVGLAPLAALVLILGSGQGSLKIAGVLALLAVVLIGLSITLRKDADSIRMELEDSILDEVDSLREDVRHDIATAARATHRQFSEKLQYLHDSVEALRAQVEALRLGYERPDARPVGVPGPPPPAPHVGSHHGGPPGVVRQTETVHVTTRHTFVDPHAEGQDGRGTVYGRSPEPPTARRPEAVWREPASYGQAGGRHDAGDGVSWTEERLRERYEAARAEAARAPLPGRRRERGYDDDPGDDERWSGMRAGDRWASVRTDDRGRELRMGERRAAMHTDETGTELRFEDRWTSVRRDDQRVRYDEPTSRWGDDDRWGDDEQENRWERRGGPPALPASSSEPSWDDRRWHEGETARGGDRRQYDYEYSDERWR